MIRNFGKPVIALSVHEHSDSDAGCQGTGLWHLLKLTRKTYLNCIYGKAGEMIGLWFMIQGSGLKVMTDTTMIDRLKQFVESEMRSCSMEDFWFTIQG